MQSLIRVLAIAGLIVAGSVSGAKATADGLKAFQGTTGETHKSADFTPAAKSYRLSRDLRDRLSRLRVSEKQ